MQPGVSLSPQAFRNALIRLSIGPSAHMLLYQHDRFNLMRHTQPLGDSLTAVSSDDFIMRVK